VQTPGTFGHQNLLGLLSHLIVFPFFALLLAGPRGWLPIAAVLSGVVVEVMTASRATIGLAGLGFGLLFMLSALRQWTPRKAVVLAVGVVAISVLVPIALLSLGQRFAGGAAPEADYDERAAFETAASMMLSDHAFGVGPNNYVMAANVGGYNQAAGVASTEGSEGANVHNIYWLTAAETGYLGVLTFVLLLARPLILAFSCGWRHRWDQRGDLLLGLGVGLLIVYIHSKFEWSLAVAEAQYMIVITMGLVAGIAQQINSSQPIGYAPHKTPVMHGFAGRR
jgi:O-antigen ligase